MKRCKNKAAIERKKRKGKTGKLRKRIDNAADLEQLKKVLHDILDVVEI